MGFQLSYDEDHKIVISRVTEVFDWSVIEKMVPEMTKIIKEHECRHVIMDFRQAEFPITVSKIYMTPEKLFTEFMKYGIDIRRLHRAFLLKKHDESFHFFETVSINQSQTVRIFYDEKEAVLWLRDE
jgi:hypothetical protein